MDVKLAVINGLFRLIQCKRLSLTFLICWFFALPVAATVDIQGASDPLQENLRLYLQDIPLQDRRPSVRRRALAAVIEAAEALGYYNAEFQLQAQDNGWRLSVIEGPRVVWQAPQLTVNGNPWTVDQSPIALTAVVDRLQNKMSAAEGLDHRDYENLKRSWLQNWHNQGYWQARYEHAELQVNLQSHQSTTILRLESGPQFLLDDLNFSGSHIQAKLLARIAGLIKGEVVTQNKLLQLQRNLENSNYFSLVDMNVEHSLLPADSTAKGLTGTAEGRTSISVVLEDSPDYQFSVGAGYGTDTGPRGRLRMENPHVNRRGHRLVNDIQVSEISQAWAANYKIPLQWEGKNPLETFFEANASYAHEDVEGTESTVWEVGGYYSDVWGRGWRLRSGISLFSEEEVVGDEPPEDTLFAMPAIYLSRLVAPQIVDPLHGHSEVLSMSGSSPALGADTTFIRLQASYKRLFSLGGTQTLLARVEGGVLWTDNITDVPYSQRFFAGGDQSVRGYDFNALSERNADGSLRGAQYLNTASLEYSVKVLPSWRVAVFSDAGRAYDDSSKPWNVSAGVGIRWISPIGAVRIDLAAPVNNSEYSGVRLHISMGGVL